VTSEFGFQHGEGKADIFSGKKYGECPGFLRVENKKTRNWYLTEAADQDWSTRALDRQINSLYYERLLMSREKKSVIDEMLEKTGSLAPAPEDIIKDPYVLEFLGLQDGKVAVTILCGAEKPVKCECCV